MKKNIDNMTMAEIKKYVEVLERTNKRFADSIGQYVDFMATVETFEIELKKLEETYENQSMKSLKNWLDNKEAEKEDELSEKYYVTIKKECVVNWIAELFDRFVKYPC